MNGGGSARAARRRRHRFTATRCRRPHVSHMSTNTSRLACTLLRTYTCLSASATSAVLEEKLRLRWRHNQVVFNTFYPNADANKEHSFISQRTGIGGQLYFIASRDLTSQ